jgi:hypothetical protein
MLRQVYVAVGTLSALAAAILVTFYLLGDLGRDSDQVMYGIIGCVFLCALCFWGGTRGPDDAPRGGGR